LGGQIPKDEVYGKGYEHIHLDPQPIRIRFGKEGRRAWRD